MDEGLGGGVSGEIVEKVGCGSAGAGEWLLKMGGELMGEVWEELLDSILRWDVLESVLQLVQNQ